MKFSSYPHPLVLVALLLFGCTTPEPKIITQEVKVAVPVRCAPKLGPRPALMTKEQIRAALAAAASLDDRVKILTAQALLYVGWVPVLEAGIDVCMGNPPEQRTGGEG